MIADGVLVLDKPAGVSSAAAVDRVKRELGLRRAGHGGTLDPLATGVLPICLGAATKIAAYLLADDKAYEAELVLGVETDTLDRTGATVATGDTRGVTEARLVAALAARVGEHDQVPPMYSAIRQGGVRLYDRARAGEDVPRAPRRVRIDQLALVAFAPPRARVAIACSKGTYVRSLVADLGHDLGCGAHVAELRRTRAGPFTLVGAQTLGALDVGRLVSMVDATRLPIVHADRELVGLARSGVQVAVERLGAPAPAAVDGRFQLVDADRRLVAIAHAEVGRVVYDRVFPA